MNKSSIFMEWRYGAIDDEDSSYHGYYIIKFSSSPYILQEGLSIVGQVICYGERLCEGAYLFPININYHYYVL